MKRCIDVFPRVIGLFWYFRDFFTQRKAGSRRKHKQQKQQKNLGNAIQLDTTPIENIEKKHECAWTNCCRNNFIRCSWSSFASSCYGRSHNRCYEQGQFTVSPVVCVHQVLSPIGYSMNAALLEACAKLLIKSNVN